MTTYGTLYSIQNPGIVYSCVSRGSSVLACHASCDGNFSDVVPNVLSMIPTDEDGRMTYTSGDYMFHYVCESGVIFLCITDDDFERSRAFLFLEEIKLSFTERYGLELQSYTPYALNTAYSNELSTQMQAYSEDSYGNSNGDMPLIRLDAIRVRNLDIYNESGQLEQLELMESHDNVSIHSLDLQIDAEGNRCRECCKKYYKGLLIILVLGLIVLLVIASVLIIAFVDEKQKNTASERDLMHFR